MKYPLPLTVTFLAAAVALVLIDALSSDIAACVMLFAALSNELARFLFTTAEDTDEPDPEIEFR